MTYDKNYCYLCHNTDTDRGKFKIHPFTNGVRKPFRNGNFIISLISMNSLAKAIGMDLSNC